MRIKKKFRFPIFVKPATLGSSVGMTRVKAAHELPAAMDLAAEFALKIMVERGRERRARSKSLFWVTTMCALPSPAKSCPIANSTITRRNISKSGTKLVIPAPLTKKQVSAFQECAVRAFRAIDGAGMARCDFFLEKRTGKILINELNTIPGFTAISMYPKLWEASGLPYPKLIDRLIELAFELHREKARTKYSIELPPGAAGALEA